MNLKVKKDQTSLKVVLPRISLIYFWSADPEESLSMTSYKKDSVEIKKEKILEGTSPELLTFEFELPPEDSDLTFQMANINDVEKAFSDQKAIYQLTIRITRSKSLRHFKRISTGTRLGKDIFHLLCYTEGSQIRNGFVIAKAVL